MLVPAIETHQATLGRTPKLNRQHRANKRHNNTHASIGNYLNTVRPGRRRRRCSIQLYVLHRSDPRFCDGKSLVMLTTLFGSRDYCSIAEPVSTWPIWSYGSAEGYLRRLLKEFSISTLTGRCPCGSMTKGFRPFMPPGKKTHLVRREHLPSARRACCEPRVCRATQYCCV